MARKRQRFLGDEFGRQRPLGRLRYVAAFAALLGLASAGVLWAVVGAPEPDTVALPEPQAVRTTPFRLEAQDGIGSPPSPVATVAAKPSTSRTPVPADRPTSGRTRPPVAGLTAQYKPQSTWAEGFVADVVVSNPTATAKTWEVRLAYPPEYGVRVDKYWVASIRSRTGVLVFTGGPLAPGEQVMFGFQAEKVKPAEANLTACTVNGVAC